jgi:hypothetical protein
VPNWLQGDVFDLALCDKQRLILPLISWVSATNLLLPSLAVTLQRLAVVFACSQSRHIFYTLQAVIDSLSCSTTAISVAWNRLGNCFSMWSTQRGVEDSS